MEDGLKQWSLLFDDESYNVWHNASPKLALVQVMFHNLMKQLHIIQKEFNLICIEEIAAREGCENIVKQDKCTSIKDTPGCNSTAATLPESIPEDINISVIDSPNVLKDTSVLSVSEVNISDSIFNRNVLNNESPMSMREIPEESISVSPVINRRKSHKKKKLAYPELNTTEKSMLQEFPSCSYSQTSLINFNTNEKNRSNTSITSFTNLNKTDRFIQNTSLESKGDKNSDIVHTPKITKIRKRLHELKSFSSTTIKDQKIGYEQEEFDTTKVAPLVSDDANKTIDATILLSCPSTEEALVDTSFLKAPKVGTTKPMFLSKWQQRKLQEEDLDEQNCSKCGNFGGFKDLSPTMCGTNGYKCQKHRKKYMRPNTPSAIWNLDFPESNS